MVRMSTRRRKPKKSRTHKCRQRGGVPPLNALRFRYTNREDRGEWVDALYPLAPIILEQITQIDWSRYHFEGETVVTVFPESASNNNKFNLTQLKTYEATFSKLPQLRTRMDRMSLPNHGRLDRLHHP